MSRMHSLEGKIVVLGSQGVGKTCLVVRFVGNMFNKHVSPTIGASFFTCKMVLDDHRIKLQVWDTAGQERFRSMAPLYYRNANAAMLVYDITSEESFNDMKSWALELKKNVDERLVLCVLGNKTDLEQERKVTTEEAQEYAASISALYYETSAYENKGIQEAFTHVGRELIAIYEDAHDSGCAPDPNSFYGRNVPGLNDNVNLHERYKQYEMMEENQSRCCGIY